ncbi:hypothetical protein [Longimicrobium sp.]|uniref:hypothetical protein n=1 Tax=Longimicrobium sp. TaxID=2029185 RepID=UPI002E37AF6D|nr:hypothetical protein [Longimicrobium sp.]HEX6037354.1 hypothetical protein [Longimicrobium sp.]
MSKTIEVSDQDYARIQHAAEADGMPVDAWVVENLPLNGNGKLPEPALLDAEGKPAKTMYDLLKDHIGVVNSGGAELGENPPCQSSPEPRPTRTMADLLAGRVGVFESKGDGRLSQNTGEQFTDYLEAKRRAGRL